MTQIELDNPFWRFSLRVYAAPGVSTECLELQESLGMDVNVVLFAARLGAARGLVLQAADFDRINEAAATWSADVVRPLRAVRQRLKPMPEMAHGDVQALRKRVADTELFAEQIEQALLYRLARVFRKPEQAPGEAAMRANVAAVLGMRGGSFTAFPLDKLLAAAVPVAPASE
jgi:uncharacterized protein (TIGR02444 family)